MDEAIVFNGLIIGWFVLAAVVFILLFFIIAPYGRYTRKGWGPLINSRFGWLIMEAPASLIFAFCFLIGEYKTSVTAIIFLIIWEAHYIHRAFIYPWSLPKNSKPMPVLVMLMGFIFNICNGYLNGRFLFSLSGGYQNQWLMGAPFIAGVLLFISGYIINRQADLVLRNLRLQGGDNYKIPYGSLYGFISSPNYFGEIIIWIGWAVMTWSIAGLAFAVWTIANLVPRAYSNHIWYRNTFPDYPPERKVLIPRIW